jgi:hypothetical protein
MKADVWHHVPADTTSDDALAHNVTDTDTWIDEELASLKHSLDVPGERSRREPRAVVPLEEASAAAMPPRPDVQRASTAGYSDSSTMTSLDIAATVAAILASIVIGALIPLLLH